MKFDRLGKKARLQAARRSETRYYSQLHKIAKAVGDIVKGLAPDGHIKNVDKLSNALGQYSQLILPWAEATAEHMVADVNARNEKGWLLHSQDMGVALRREIKYAPTGALFQELMAEQVNLIQSIPLGAAQRVHGLATAALIDSRRSTEIAAEIGRTTEATAARARMIARTEVARANATLTEARARHIGSEGYIWRTAGDSDVRESHQEMEGKYVRWDTNGGKGPHLSDGTTTHAGCIYNCRCFAEPVIPTDF